ncbi:MAG TPA: hypothetical protein VGJ66_07560 [Pyrinomonadaceae bacterium]
MGEQEIRQDAEKLHKESRGGTSLKEVGPFASNETYDSHDSGKDEPAGRPEERDICLAEWIGKERRIVIGMAVCPEKRQLTLESWKAQTEVVGETIGDTTRVKHPVFMREFAVNRVDVIVIIYSNEAAESCVA